MLGKSLGSRYEVAGELGRGGMGVVYLARDPVLKRDVAVKVVPPAHFSADAEERFLREAQIVARMDHPGIVPIYDLGRDPDGSLYFVMPVVPGKTLRQLLKLRPLRLGDVIEIAVQAAEALDYSHTRDVVHRDVKPENLMVAYEEASLRVRVMDFGLARAAADDRLTHTGMIVGTACYVSPEQASARPIDGRSDIYSLGTLLYECVTGEPPFTGDVHSVFYRIVHEMPRPPRSLGAPIREELEELILRCLAKDPWARPQRGAEVADALRRHRARLEETEREHSVSSAPGTARTRVPLSPFIGREKELTEVQRRLNAASEGESQLAVVSGEPGIGKTRLLQEIAALARVRKIRVLTGTFVEEEHSFSYQGFCELIQDYFQRKDPAGASSGARERPDFSDLAPGLVTLFPVLAEVPELRGTATTPQPGGGPAGEHTEERVALFELIARTLIRIGNGRPLLLVLENLHGAQASIEALAYVVRRLRATPTFFLGSYRETEVDRHHPLLKALDGFSGDTRFASVTLGALTPAEHRRLVESALSGADLSEGVAERLHAASEGNPFFTIELLRSLVESGVLARDSSGAYGFSQNPSLLSDALPATIQSAVERRIERLEEGPRDVLSIASVLGKSFAAEELEELARTARFDEAVESLAASGLLIEDRDGRSERFSFASGIVRDVLYQRLPRRRRRQLHRAAAELLERRHAGRLERVYPQLVSHFSAGDVPEKTVQYGLLLAQRHLSAWNAEEAIRVARTTLEFLEGEEGSGPAQAGEEDSLRAGEAHFLLARGLRMTGNLTGALREADSAAQILPRERAPELFLFAAEAAWQARRIEEARLWAERGIAAARFVGSSEVRARLLSLAATVANLRGEYQRAAELAAEVEREARVDAFKELPHGGRVAVGMPNPVRAEEPADIQTIEEDEVLGNVFETLVGSDDEGTLVPNLAQGWTVKEEGRVLEIQLRSGVHFSDGAPLKAEDARLSLERALRRRRGLPLAATLEGAADFLSGAAPTCSGLRVVAPDRLEIRVSEPLPILAAFLADGALAMVRRVETVETAETTETVETSETDGRHGRERLLGTGPFVVASREGDCIRLARNPRPWREPSRIDELEFRTALPAHSLAAGLRSGALDLARDVPPRDLDDLLRDARFRSGLLEAWTKSTSFVQFHLGSAHGSLAPVRRAMAGIVRPQDLVWAAVGRFAMPATSLIPPGVLGHDSGRRRPNVSLETARSLLSEAGLTPPITLRAAVHPFFLGRFRALTDALLDLWKQIGIEVNLTTTTMDEYVTAWETGRDVDLLIGRWFLDYPDPDAVTHALYHSRHGTLRAFFSSPKLDDLLGEARAERRPAAREALYRKLETLLLDRAAVIPLSYDVDVRLAGPSLVGAALRTSPPFVSYAQLARLSEPAPSGEAMPGGVLRIALPGHLHDLDPARAWTVEASEVLPNVFETLTRDVEGAHVVPWIASEVFSETEGLRYRVRLRPGVRFHDGRQVTARDVRFSFERLLQSEGSDHRLLFAPIQGARDVIAGRTRDLAGLSILSPSELVISLEERVSFFPVFLSSPALAILPEGTGAFTGGWREGTIGTGPFRVVRFEPGVRLELEKYPGYWRPNSPRADGLIFRFGVPSEQIKTDFLEGRLSLASDLLPADAEALRGDPTYAAGYCESPLLSTYFVLLNRKQGPLADDVVRRRLAESLRWGAISLVGETLGRLAVPAAGLIPPGLLGSYIGEPGTHTRPVPSWKPQAVVHELTAVVHPVFLGEFAGFYSALIESLALSGFTLKVLGSTMDHLLSFSTRTDCDLVLTRWIADYPDADGFVRGIAHSEEGLWGRYLGSAALDDLAARARAEADPQSRHALYRRAEEVLSRESVLVPLFHEQVYRFARPEVQGLRIGFTRPVVAYEALSLRR